MILTKLKKQLEKLDSPDKETLLEIMDLKSEMDTHEVIQHIQKYEEIMDNKIEELKNTVNTKYNLLLGMISFLGFIITVITVILGLIK